MKNRWKIMMVLMGCAGVVNAAYVTIGNTGNLDDTTGYGGVGYTYQISATEVTIAQMAASGAGDGGENYWNDGTRTVGTVAPACKVSLYEAMKYCNYLTSGNVNNGYYSDGGGGVWQANALSHIDYATANGLTYFVPTEDEWYKAAYFDASGANGYSLYANGTGTVPTEGGGATGWTYNLVNSSPNYIRDVALGTTEQNETVNMMGNIWEWMEDSSGVIRGGSYGVSETYLRSSARIDYTPSNEGLGTGFRPVEVVPEPASAMMLLFGAGVGMIIHRLRRTAQRR